MRHSYCDAFGLDSERHRAITLQTCTATIMTLATEDKSHLFFSFALITGIAIAGDFACRIGGVSGVHALMVVLPVSLFGLIVWVVGRLQPKGERKQAPANEASAQELSEEGPLTFAKQPQYLGGILSLGGLALAIYIFLFEQRLPGPKPVAAAPPVARPATRFPELKLQGLTLHTAKSSAVINGRVVQLGEWVEGVQVVVIDRQGVGLELEGRTNRIQLTP